MTNTVTLLVIMGTFLTAGMVKGMIGLGLPTVSLACLTVGTDLPSAMAFLLAPLIRHQRMASHSRRSRQNDSDLTLALSFHGARSVAALLPAMAGMILGQRIRPRLSEHVFRKLFFISLLALGDYIITSAFGAFR